MTTSYFYSYIETTSYQTTYTITLRARQSRYSLTGEWWESNDGNNWYKVTNNDGRENYLNYYGEKEYFCYGTCCSGASVRYRWMNPNVWVIANSLKAGTSGSLNSIVALDRGGVNGLCRGWQLTQKATPVILYIRSNESVTASGINGYTFTGRDESLYESCWGEPFCLLYVTEWGRTYKLQAIELVNWDTGEVYASVNQTSVTFNINANTIVRFKYVLVDSWSRSWTVILPPKTPEPTPEECQQILNDPSKRCTGAWCSCLKTYDPEAWKKEPCCPTSTVVCLSVHVTSCCSGDAHDACLNSWSVQGGSRCGSSLPITVSWSASWSLKPGWALAGIGKTGYGNVQCGLSSLTEGSASGSCTLNAIEHATQWVVVIFRRT